MSLGFFFCFAGPAACPALAQEAAGGASLGSVDASEAEADVDVVVVADVRCSRRISFS